MDMTAKLREFHGAARYKDLVATPAEARDLRRAVDAGTVVKHGPGLYALPNADLAVVAARHFGGRLTAESALACLPGFDTGSRREIHVEVPRNCSATRPKKLSGIPVVVHRHSAGIRPDPFDPPVVPVARALAQMLRGRKLAMAIVAVDQALNRGLVTREDIAAEFARNEPRLRRWALENSHPRAASPLETLARLVLALSGVQYEVNPHIEGVGFVDLLVEGWIVIETDGFAYHSDRVAFQNDRRRDRELQQRGYVVFRFTRDEIMADAWIVARAVERALRGRPRAALPMGAA